MKLVEHCTMQHLQRHPQMMLNLSSSSKAIKQFAMLICIPPSTLRILQTKVFLKMESQCVGTQVQACLCSDAFLKHKHTLLLKCTSTWSGYNQICRNGPVNADIP